MSRKRLLQIGLVVPALMTFAAVALAHGNQTQPTGTLVETLRHGLGGFQDLAAAKKAGHVGLCSR